MPKIIRLIDRTRTIADWKCPRSRYWGYEWNGRGIVAAGNSIELFMGITLHDALAAIATLTLNDKVVDIDELANTAHRQMYLELAPEINPGIDDVEYATEQASLVEGLVRGFYKHVWPRLMSKYTIVCTEEEMEWPLTEDGQFIFMTKPDLVLEDKDSKELVYVEYKSTSWKKEGWINQWDTAVQLHSSIKATERSLGRTVSGVQIVGLYKGYESYGKQSSPFCYAYIRRGRPPFSQDSIEYSYKYGHTRSAVWEQPGGLKAWVDQMPENVLADQYPMTPVIYVNDDLVERFFAQRLLREMEISKVANLDPSETQYMDAVFPQRFDQCTPSFGWKCQYKKLCHGFVADPLAEGYVLREPHHAQERDQLGLEPKG